MPFTINCTNPACRQAMGVREEHVGKSVKCPRCATMSVVPAPPAPSSIMPPSQAPSQASAGGSSAVMAPPRPAPQKTAPPPPTTPLSAPPAPPKPDPTTRSNPSGTVPDLAGPTSESIAPAPAPPMPSTASMTPLLWALMGGGIFFLTLLSFSTFFSWVSVSSVRWGPRADILDEDFERFIRVTIPGVRYANGKIIFCIGLLSIGAVVVAMLRPRFRRPILVGAAAFGTFTFLMMIGHFLSTLGNTGAGVWIGLFASLGIAGCFIPAFFQDRSSPMPPRNLLLAEASAGVLGIVYLILRLI